MSEGVEELTEKEKQTLRLMVRGYDAKSLARHFDLSVHTINERLRSARRKLGVSSSREAARMLTQWEGPSNNSFGDRFLGEDQPAGEVPDRANGKPGPTLGWIVGGFTMLTLATTFALTLMSQPADPELSRLAQDVPTGGTVSITANADTLQTTRAWLALVDARRWEESYAATGRAFQDLNSAQTWASVSEQVRVPLGEVISRIFLEQENVPVPPRGAQVIRFRTSFANRPDVTETLTLVPEDGGWKVVAYLIG